MFYLKWETLLPRGKMIAVCAKYTEGVSSSNHTHYLEKPNCETSIIWRQPSLFWFVLSFVSISFGSYSTGACKPSMIFVSGLSTPDQLVLCYPVLCSQNSCHLFSVAAQNIYYSYFPLGLWTTGPVHRGEFWQNPVHTFGSKYCHPG